MPFITDEQLLADLDQFFRMQSLDLPIQTPQIVPKANGAAYRAIQEKLLARGFTQAQVDGWSRGADFQYALGKYYTFLYMSHTEATDLWIEKFNWLAQLDEEVEPDPGATTGGSFGAGLLDTTNDRFTRDTHW
jgi:hypothetical protein